jgi:hypothetical protein
MTWSVENSVSHAMTPTPKEVSLVLHYFNPDHDDIIRFCDFRNILRLNFNKITKRKRKKSFFQSLFKFQVIIQAVVLCVASFISVSVSGASLNPARGSSVSLLLNKYDNLWIYFLGPYLGAMCASYVLMKV